MTTRYRIVEERDWVYVEYKSKDYNKSHKSRKVTEV